MIVHGVDSNDNVLPLLLDASGNVIVSATLFPETTYAAIYANINNTSLPAGTSNQLDSAIATGQAYLWKSVTMRYTGTVAGVSLLPCVVRSGSFYIVQVIAPPVSNTFYSFVFDIPMEAGDQAGVRILGATLNDDLLGYLTYRRIR